MIAPLSLNLLPRSSQLLNTSPNRDISSASALIGISSVYSKNQSAHLAAAQFPEAQQSRKVLQANCLCQEEVLQERKPKKGLSLFLLLCVLVPLPFVTGCGAFSKAEAEAQPSSRRSERGGGSTSVEVATAKTGTLQEPLEYRGSTRPFREVSLRAQVEGRLLNLLVGVGDPVKQGQILARLDDSLLLTTVSQTQSELAALQSEVARAQTQVKDAQALAEQARAELRQAQVDAARLRSLYSSGVIPQQQTELAQTEAATAQQRLSSATAKIATEQQAVEAARGRVAAQRAAVAQAQERKSYALLASPIAGVVLEQVSEPGNLIQPGGEVLRLGDFSSVKVVVPVSELELSNIRVGQSVQVRLDAFPNEELTGRVTRLSPAADATARQLPVEIVIPNSTGSIGSGLLARVSFGLKTASRVVVPQTALQESGQRSKSRQEATPASTPERGSNSQSKEATLFVVTGSGANAKVQARRVQVGTRASGKVEILSGLRAGEQFVARSAKPLKDGEAVRLSILSQTPEKQEQR